MAQASGSNDLQADTSELQKLWELKEAGALTDDEFAQQEALLLGSGTASR
jgi:hypothetical protein